MPPFSKGNCVLFSQAFYLAVVEDCAGCRAGYKTRVLPAPPPRLDPSGGCLPCQQNALPLNPITCQVLALCS